MLQDITHMGSRENLLGSNPGQDLILQYSNEKQVTDQTPPTFLVHSADDLAVPVENSISFYQALVFNKVASEMHIYPKGGHGYSLALDDGHIKNWSDLLVEWMESIK
jgi:dipeptidyl aminopeptidase/acylaminoacyl peptidase